MLVELLLTAIEPDLPFVDAPNRTVVVLSVHHTEQRMLVSIDPPMVIYFGEHQGYAAQYFELTPRWTNTTLSPAPVYPIRVYLNAILTDSPPNFETFEPSDGVPIGYGSVVNVE
tara:strand:- start:41998 stop:42339 length:342 start_codon:yes stop_codon:yes gene_type:complete